MITLDCWKSFHCIADKCRHSCCKGWEIYIDDDTLRKYATVGGEPGRELRRSIRIDEDGAAFATVGPEARCPFLNEKGLCRLILELGEEYLSEICTEHPRFYHTVNGVEEQGFGLCCEESANLVLSAKRPLRLNGQWYWRENAIKTAQNRRLPLEKRLRLLSALPKCNRKALFLSLERMDGEWTAALERWDGELLSVEQTLAVPLENLLVYFLFRHWTEEADTRALAFSVLSVRVLASMHTEGCGSLRELSRLYSAEIEYSDENTDAIRAWLG